MHENNFYITICLECQKISARLLVIRSVTNHDCYAAFGTGPTLPLVSPALVFFFLFTQSISSLLFWNFYLSIVFLLFGLFFSHFGFSFTVFFSILTRLRMGPTQKTKQTHNRSLSDLPRLPVTRPCRGPPCPRSKFLLFSLNFNCCVVCFGLLLICSFDFVYIPPVLLPFLFLFKVSKL